MSKTQLIVRAFCLWIEGWIIILAARPISWFIFVPYETAVEHYRRKAEWQKLKEAGHDI
jgi:hypothetical protein